METLSAIRDYAYQSSLIVGLGVAALFLIAASATTLVSDLIFPGVSLEVFGAGKKNVWAVVTGSSDGIGAEYASALAKAGFNIFLVSRTQSKLDTIATLLSKKYGIQARTLAMDASDVKDSDFEKLAKETEGLDVGILINNVGQSHDIPVPFHITPLKEMNHIINVNVLFTLRTTQLFLPRLIARKEKSLVLTMGSFGGYLPTPLLATYSGSKAFLQTWSIALASELRDSPVVVKLVNSYLVTSKMSKIRKASLSIPTPKVFVASVLGNIKGGPVMTPFWAHNMMAWGLNLIGRENSFVVEGNKAMHMGIRGKALRKREKAAKGQ